MLGTLRGPRCYDLAAGSSKRAVDALSLEVRHGEVFALLGHNGAGKTTTVDMLVPAAGPCGDC